MIANRDMVLNTHLSRDDYVLTCRYRTRDACLRHNEVVFTNLAVVSDHHLVVDSSSRIDSSITHLGSINHRARSDSHIVANVDCADMRQPFMLSIDGAIPKTITSQSRTCFNGYLTTDGHAGLKHRIWTNLDVVSNLASVLNNDATMDVAVVANRDVFTDIGEVSNGRVGSNDGGFCNRCLG